MTLLDGEHTERINERTGVIVSPAHTFGTDAILLANFSLPAPNAKCCDFGTGCGIIPFYWMAHGVKSVSGAEIQAEACSQVRRSVEMNGCRDSFTLFEGDILSVFPKELNGTFDVITMNPPYTVQGHGIQSSSVSDRIARHETMLTLDGLCGTAARLLKFGGSFCICLKPERLPEAMEAMRRAKTEPKRLRFVSAYDGKAPWLFLLEGRKGRNPGLTVMPELHTRSEEMKEIYGCYAADT